MENPPVKKKNRNPLLAALLSVLLPGLGQLYSGRWRRALTLIALALILSIGGRAVVAVQAGSAAGVYSYAILLISAVFLWVFALVDAIIAARRAGRIALAAYNRWYVYIGVMAVSGSIAVLTDFLPIPSTRSYSMPSSSMRPTLEVGDYVDAATHAFADRLPERGEIAVFKRPGGDEDYVKRIIAVPGDRVQMRGGTLYLNDAPVPRERVGDYRLPDRGETLMLYRETLPGGRNYQIIEMSDDGPLDNTALFIVPAGSVFVLGDNRDNSSDSRSFGFVPLDNLKDRPFVIWWSTDRSRIGMSIQ